MVNIYLNHTHTDLAKDKTKKTVRRGLFIWAHAISNDEGSWAMRIHVFKRLCLIHTKSYKLNKKSNANQSLFYNNCTVTKTREGYGKQEVAINSEADR